jgi:hypothetical protein
MLAIVGHAVHFVGAGEGAVFAYDLGRTRLCLGSVFAGFADFAWIACIASIACIAGHCCLLVARLGQAP